MISGRRGTILILFSTVYLVTVKYWTLGECSVNMLETTEISLLNILLKENI